MNIELLKFIVLFRFNRSCRKFYVVGENWSPFIKIIRENFSYFWLLIEKKYYLINDYDNNSELIIII